MKTPHVHTELKNYLFQYVFDIASHSGAIIGYDWKKFGILMLLLTSKLLVTISSRFPTIKNILNG